MLAAEESRFTLFTGELWYFFRFFDHFCRSVMITSIQGSIHQGHEAFSEHARDRQYAFMSLAALLTIDWIRLIPGHKQISMTSYVMEIACIYMH